MSKDWKFYTKELSGKECQCGRVKRSMMSLCYGCYKKLPGHMQRDLYRKLGNGYEEAYDDAVEFLTG
jgi:hypothetical protein